MNFQRERWEDTEIFSGRQYCPAMFLILQTMSHAESWILSIRNLQKKTTRWLVLLEDVECQMPPCETRGKPAEEQDRWYGQRHTSANHTSVHKHSSYRAHSSHSGDRGTLLRHQSVRQGLQSDDSAPMAGLIYLMEKWHHTLNAWWSFLLPFLKGVYWTCWLEEVMARDKYGFLGQKKTWRQRCWEDAKSSLWVTLIGPIPRVPLQGHANLSITQKWLKGAKHGSLLPGCSCGLWASTQQPITSSGAGTAPSPELPLDTSQG